MSIKSVVLKNFAKSFLNEINTFLSKSETVIFKMSEENLALRLQEEGDIVVICNEFNFHNLLETDFVLRKDDFSDMVLFRCATTVQTCTKELDELTDSHIAIRQKIQKILTTALNNNNEIEGE